MERKLNTFRNFEPYEYYFRDDENGDVEIFGMKFSLLNGSTPNNIIVKTKDNVTHIANANNSSGLDTYDKIKKIIITDNVEYIGRSSNRKWCYIYR